MVAPVPDPSNPLIVQSDLTVLFEVASPRAAEARAALARFAELERSPEHIHTYRITPLSLWNGATAGLTAADVVATLNGFAKYPVPDSVLHEAAAQLSRFGRLRLEPHGDGMCLVADDPVLLVEVTRDRHVADLIGAAIDDRRVEVPLRERGALKQALLRLGWPAADHAGFSDGEALDADLRCELRPYQQAAVDTWWADGSAAGGNGVLVLPCGAGKTIIGLSSIARAATSTLIIVTNVSAARQWIAELLAKTSLTEDQIGEYNGTSKEIRPVTVATYQILTYRKPGSGAEDEVASFPHLELFGQRDWGLIIYDEVHLLPAPVFRATAEIQAIRRLGLTATLVREDNKEADVFTLIGPKRYDAPWKELEAAGWIAPAVCTEMRVALDESLRMDYATAPERDRYRIASTCPAKLDTLGKLLVEHAGDRVLIIGQYLDQLKQIAERVDAPVITGQTAQRTRDRLFGEFRTGERQTLIVSKVANFSIDLPDANVAIQLSGTFGSRQEEAQRLGRVLRPKSDGGQAHFYTIVTRDTIDQQFAAKRQRFLAEQGYTYRIVDVG